MYIPISRRLMGETEVQTFRITLEEVPSYKSPMGRWSGFHTGEAEISYTDTSDWFVSDIWLDCDNRKNGEAAEGGLEQISQAYDKELFAGLSEAVLAFYGETIEQKISDELSEEPRRSRLMAAE